MYSYVLYNNIEKSGFNAISAYLLWKILSGTFKKKIFWNPSLSQAVIPEVCSVLVGEKTEGILDGSVASRFHWDGADWIDPFYTQTEAALYLTQQQTGSCLEHLPFYIKIENKVLFWFFYLSTKRFWCICCVNWIKFLMSSLIFFQ